uniref:Transcriptional repressor CTCFL n=1 Tax=Cacopsylla melanoneura TaxID=428564 RepID=A0A8D8Z031_9HEMI
MSLKISDILCVSTMSEMFVSVCSHCKDFLSNNTEELLNHCKQCKNVLRLEPSFRYVCFSCDYHSYNSNNMRKHIRKHTGDKPFICKYCHAHFAENTTLKKHISVKHGETVS